MLKQEDVNRVRDLIIENLGCSESEVVPDAKLIDDLGADSLDLAELAISLEEDFEIPEVSYDEVEKLSTVNDLYEYVEARLAGK